MMNCPVCRSQNLESAKYCGNCGHAFSRSPLMKCANEHIYSAAYTSCPYCPPVGMESAYATSKSPTRTGNLTGPLENLRNGSTHPQTDDHERPFEASPRYVVEPRTTEGRADGAAAERAVTLIEEPAPPLVRIANERSQETPLDGLDGFEGRHADVAEVPVPTTESSPPEVAKEATVEPVSPPVRAIDAELERSSSEVSPAITPLPPLPPPATVRPAVPPGQTVGREENGRRIPRAPSVEADRKTIITPNVVPSKQGLRGKLVGWLISYSSHPDGQDFRLYAGYNRLGANPVCDIVIDDDTVSGSHAILVYREGRCLIKDDLSRNGTYVNGREITEAHPLQNYDQIRVGNTHLTFVSAQRV
jgi:hypothetical protein